MSGGELNREFRAPHDQRAWNGLRERNGLRESAHPKRQTDGSRQTTFLRICPSLKRGDLII
jgi:hypothetical protein